MEPYSGGNLIEDYLTGKTPLLELRQPDGEVLKLYLKETNAGFVLTKDGPAEESIAE